MIDIKTIVHDKFALEFKFSYKVRKTVKQSHFSVNTWMFVPNSLQINPGTYNRDDFYRDTGTNTRLITPVFAFHEIASGTAIPLNNLKRAMEKLANEQNRDNATDYEYQIKMFSVIFKSSIRKHLSYIFNYAKKEDYNELINVFLFNVEDIFKKYISLAHIIKTPTVTQEAYNYYVFGYEFISNLIEKHLYDTIVNLEKKAPDIANHYKQHIFNILENERQYKTENKFTVVDPESLNHNNDMVFRLGALKKYIESDLFLDTKKKRDGVLVEQIYYSFAAGLSMVFATAIAFMFQFKYGNFTLPLFVALVVSYMLKDRIKELMRHYQVYKKSSKYYDNKTFISIKDKKIGLSKESFDFVLEKNVPGEVMKIRNRIPLIEADNRYSNEKIILFRKIVQIDNEALARSANYNIDGIVEIIRMSMLSFMRKTDNPEFPLYVPDKDFSVKQITGVRNYYMNIVIQANYENSESIQRFRVIFNRDGIYDINEIS